MAVLGDRFVRGLKISAQVVPVLASLIVIWTGVKPTFLSLREWIAAELAPQIADYGSLAIVIGVGVLIGVVTAQLLNWSFEVLRGAIDRVVDGLDRLRTRTATQQFILLLLVARTVDKGPLRRLSEEMRETLPEEPRLREDIVEVLDVLDAFVARSERE